MQVMHRPRVKTCRHEISALRSDQFATARSVKELQNTQPAISKLVVATKSPASALSPSSKGVLHSSARDLTSGIALWLRGILRLLQYSVERLAPLHYIIRFPALGHRDRNSRAGWLRAEGAGNLALEP